MDVSDITKVASRKRMSEDAEKLRDKISRETAKIIKLKVAQDTAYWDLKEKLQQVESNHERLQQNMVEVQMQHETTSGQYEDELRLRPEILNKLGGTRALCEVLEEYGRRVRAAWRAPPPTAPRWRWRAAPPRARAPPRATRAPARRAARPA
ncbi:uncharacterized protein LOC115441496 [Manduca sexta]|uniref:uncharacterized protein LOC115441496 n=1 Tax=Manduca sexta TaxID=7130 RepID=UPI00188E5F56|nr:uncharacterized protein LOC115441496 [Manduca sexta]